MDTNRRRVQRRLEQDGWYLDRHGSNHDIYKHPQIRGIITLPRHQELSPGVASTIAKQAGWTG
jgi:predicted RNA binding protein YcfA (HicA-like mRNA interferase family)